MDNAIPNPAVSFSRDGSKHRCAEIFGDGDTCRNCRTLMHYVLGHRLDFGVAPEVARAVHGVDDRDRLHRTVDPLTPCLKPATVAAAARP